MKGMKALLAVLAAVLAAGCASPHRPHLFSSRPLDTGATWGDLMGLSQDEIRTRLGMAATGETFASQGAWLEGDDVLYSTVGWDLPRKPCAEKAPAGYRAFTRIGDVTPQMTFRNGKLVEVHGINVKKTPIPPETPVNARCAVERVNTFGEELGYGQGGWLLIAPVMLPFMAPGAIASSDEQKKEREVFGLLRLGEAPPGGVDVFAEAYKDMVTLKKSSDSETEINVRILNPYHEYWQNRAVVRDGRVVELHPYVDTCLLRPDRSLACGQKRVV